MGYQCLVKRPRLMGLLAMANVILLAVVLWQAGLPRDASGDAAAGQSLPTDSAIFPTAVYPETRTLGHASSRLLHAPPASSASTPPALDWRQVEAPDYPTYMRNLRAIGVPEQTVRDIVTADLLKAFQPTRVEALAEVRGEFRFWEAAVDDPDARSELRRRQNELDRELGGALDELFGPEVIPPSTEHEWKLAQLEWQLSFLPPERREPIVTVLLRAAEIDAQFKSLSDGHRPTEEVLILDLVAAKTPFSIPLTTIQVPL